jgi:hypothetical protein
MLFKFGHQQHSVADIKVDWMFSNETLIATLSISEALCKGSDGLKWIEVVKLISNV